MSYKNHEGYPDPTSGRAINGVRWEELQRLREREHSLMRGQKVMLYVKCQSEEASSRGCAKNSEKVRKPYWIVELHRYCVLLKDESGICTAPSYIQLQSLMRGGD